MVKTDGGQAFPVGNPTHGGESGISKRDYFTAKALEGMVANASWVAYARGYKNGSLQTEGEFCYKATAAEAYKLADAMLAEREK
jgi:hypothetical protein